MGTRPEIIRLSRVISKLNLFCEHVLVHTGQNYDYELNQVFFDELKLVSQIIIWEQRGILLVRLKPSVK